MDPKVGSAGADAEARARAASFDLISGMGSVLWLCSGEYSAAGASISDTESMSMDMTKTGVNQAEE